LAEVWVDCPFRGCLVEDGMVVEVRVRRLSG
jgi:hypothetical protein